MALLIEDPRDAEVVVSGGYLWPSLEEVVDEAHIRNALNDLGAALNVLLFGEADYAPDLTIAFDGR